MQKRYKGLANIGATCYMNSLLQTLFMTPQFRYGIYKWNYNEKIHPKQTDSIIFQLQKLFAKLETDFPNEVTTKDLVKSFQWQDQQAQMQQDIQQFNRLLFEALEKSLTTKSQKYIHQNFVQDFFEGQLIHYTKCHECNNESARQQDFQDVIITVKNVYEKVYNDKLELGLQRYLKPEILDENNLYDCENCGKKTRAERGARFIKMPSLLNIIFQRFTFNYFTMEREKVNDRVEFPFVLNFNDYINGYDKIPNKLNEDSSEYFKTSSVNGVNGKYSVPKFSTGLGKTTMQKKTSTPSVAGKTKTKPSANTKSFLAQMRKKKKLNEDQNQDLLFVNGTTVAPESKIDVMSPVKQQPAKVGEKSSQPNNQTKQNYLVKKQQKAQQNNHNQMIPQQKNFNNKTQANQASILPPPPPLFLVPGDLSVPYKLVQNHQHESIESQLQKKKLQSEKLERQKQEQLIQLQQKNRQKISTYLKQGPLVYELYAVLVHNGTANQGHYYSYIKSYEDGKWYCFNDERVTMINVLEIQKTFGNGNSNAYALYYRMVGQESGLGHQQLSKLKVELPAYIKHRLETERNQILQKEQMKMENIENLITLKICYQLYVKQLEVYKSNSLNLVVQKARQMFNIPSQVKKENVRLRMFNPATQTKMQTFGGRSQLSLQELKIGSYKSLLLEIKGDDQQFEEYQVGTVSLRIAMIEQNLKLNSLDDSQLKLHKVTIKKNQPLSSILMLLKQKRHQFLSTLKQDQKLCVIKRHQNNDQTIHEILSVEENLAKTVDDLSILQNEILFVQPQQEYLLWPIEFQSEIYRITIKYNKPGTTEYISYLTDSRITIKQLKTQLCLFLQHSPEDIILKWGTKSGRELKDLEMTLKDARFITGTQLYLDFGIPALPGEIRIQLFWATDASSQVFNRLHEFQYLTDVPISGALKASEVKKKFILVVKKIKGIQLHQQQFRIRQRVSQKIGKIYRQKPMKQQQLIQRRQIAIQLVPDQNLQLKDFSIYFRIWDQQHWQLSPKIQLIVNKNTTMKDISELLLVDSQNKIFHDPESMGICRILSIHKFSIIDLTEMEWFTMNQEVSVVGEPMFVNADGLLYVVKDMNEEPRQLTKEEEQKFGGTVKPAIVRNKPRVYHPKQAKSMKIKVIEKEIQPEQEYEKMEEQEKQKGQNQQNNDYKQS